MSELLVDKRQFYSQAEVSRSYDRLRFGSPSGARVNARELEIVGRLLPPGGRVLDLACGTGRLSEYLAGRGYEVVALDYSPEMLAVTRERLTGLPAVRGDAFGLPFRAGSFDAVVALRLAFHFPNLPDLVGQMRQAVRPGGRVVFDTYSWSPRALMALAAGRWGGKVVAHRPARVRSALETAGLRLVQAESAFLCSPYVYRLVPLAVEQLLERLERLVPRGALARVFWSGTCG